MPAGRSDRTREHRTNLSEVLSNRVLCCWPSQCRVDPSPGGAGVARVEGGSSACTATLLNVLALAPDLELAALRLTGDRVTTTGT